MATETTLDENGISQLVSHLNSLLAANPRNPQNPRNPRSPAHRVLIGIAGIAGSGKSTLAERLAGEIEGAIAVGIDGFHLPNDVLRARGLWERKGSPETYDAAGFVALMRRLRDREQVGHYPVYDRAVRHEPVPSDQPITRDTRLILAEGQFLLLDREPWSQLAEVFDESWMLATPLETARDWVLGRHTATGRSPEQAASKYENDRRNSLLVLQESRQADRILRWPR